MTLVVSTCSVHFGDTRAVDDVSLRVQAGTILALVGPSGCGKSTLLRTIAGLVVPTAGTIGWVDSVGVERDLTEVATERRDIGLLFQNHALFTHRNVADNVGFGLRMRGSAAAAIDARVGELLALVGLCGFENRSIDGLSGGEAQRVALARALAPQPRLLLLDEPFAALDRVRRDELNDEVAALLRRLGQTAILVTHDQHEAFAVADEVAVMNEGRILRQGTPAEVWQDPRHEFVARFLGHETIIDHDGRRVAVRADAVRLIESAGRPESAAHRVGRVVECRFQGDRHRVSVRVGRDGARGGDELWRVWHDRPLAPDTAVVVELTLDRLAPLTKSEQRAVTGPG